MINATLRVLGLAYRTAHNTAHPLTPNTKCIRTCKPVDPTNYNNQQWVYDPTSLTISALWVASGLWCLDIVGPVAAGSSIVINACSGTSTQQWLASPSPPSPSPAPPSPSPSPSPSPPSPSPSPPSPNPVAMQIESYAQQSLCMSQSTADLVRVAPLYSKSSPRPLVAMLTASCMMPPMLVLSLHICQHISVLLLVGLLANS